MTNENPTPAPARTAGNKTLRNVLLVIGTLVIVGVLVITAVRVAVSLNQEDNSGTFTVSDSFESVDLRASSADVSIEYGNVENATVRFDQGDTNLTMEQAVSNDVLRITVRHPGWGWFDWGGDWWFWHDDPAMLELVLPEELEDGGVAVMLDTTAGDIRLDGSYTDVEVESTAGNVTMTGGAEDVTISTTAGDVRMRDYSVSGSLRGESTAGNTTFQLRSLPDSIDIQSTAGDVNVELPDGDYRIDTETTAGDVTQNVASDPDSDRVYRFETTAGNITLTER